MRFLKLCLYTIQIFPWRNQGLAVLRNEKVTAKASNADVILCSKTTQMFRYSNTEAYLWYISSKMVLAVMQNKTKWICTWRRLTLSMPSSSVRVLIVVVAGLCCKARQSKAPPSPLLTNSAFSKSANHLKKAERLESTTALFCIYASGTEESMHISKQSINICRAGGFS